MARYASCLLILLLAGCNAEQNKGIHDWSCETDKRRISEYEECFKNAGCRHDAYDYRIRNDLKDRVAKDCSSI